MATTELELDCTSTVNDIITRHPATMAVFNHFGLDTCCGAMLSVAEAAHANGVNADALCTELHAVARPHWHARQLLSRRRDLR
jgi:iron-sulfur cluster repair protein YtfE (RIC family)